jgi:hypothetical protein
MTRKLSLIGHYVKWTSLLQHMSSIEQVKGDHRQPCTLSPNREVEIETKGDKFGCDHSFNRNFDLCRLLLRLIIPSKLCVKSLCSRVTANHFLAYFYVFSLPFAKNILSQRNRVHPLTKSFIYLQMPLRQTSRHVVSNHCS